MDKNCILGVDPGLSGALALLDSDGLITVFDMPVTARVVNGKTKNRIDAYQLGDWVAKNAPSIRVAIVEAVGAMPGQGVTSSFGFGFTAGVIQGVLAACDVAMQEVHPQKWKRQYGLLGQPKDASRAMASKLLPSAAHLWPRKKDDGRAEAVLLALYGRMKEDVA